MDDSRLSALKKMVKQDPDDSFSRYALGLEYLSLSDNKPAKEMFEELLSKDPNYLAAYYQLGKVYEILDEVEMAGKAYEKGIYVATSQNDFHTKSELEEALNNLL
jgi:Tfp pilus assembly protein PilF